MILTARTQFHYRSDVRSVSCDVNLPFILCFGSNGNLFIYLFIYIYIWQLVWPVVAPFVMRMRGYTGGVATVRVLPYPALNRKVVFGNKLISCATFVMCKILKEFCKWWNVRQFPNNNAKYYVFWIPTPLINSHPHWSKCHIWLNCYA